MTDGKCQTCKGSGTTGVFLPSGEEEDCVDCDGEGLGEMKKVLAIFCSDLHLSHRPPTVRSGEPSWYEVMRRPLDQIRELQDEHDYCPVIIAGDIFNRWDEPAEVINFALDALPGNVYAIPGQHDLPYHGYDRIKKSAYWTLVGSSKIRTLVPGEVEYMSGGKVACYGFPWGFDIEAPEKMDGSVLNVAVIHAFAWCRNIKNSRYPGAPTHGRDLKWARRLKAFDIGIFGDNHYPFQAYGHPIIFNCGTLIRRTTKEIDYTPRVGLLYEDGSMGSHESDCSADIFVDVVVGNNTDAKQSELLELVGRLESLGGDTSLDFANSVRRVVNADEEMRQSVKDLVLRSLEST